MSGESGPDFRKCPVQGRMFPARQRHIGVVINHDQFRSPSYQSRKRSFRYEPDCTAKRLRPLHNGPQRSPGPVKGPARLPISPPFTNNVDPLFFCVIMFSPILPVSSKNIARKALPDDNLYPGKTLCRFPVIPWKRQGTGKKRILQAGSRCSQENFPAIL